MRSFRGTRIVFRFNENKKKNCLQTKKPQQNAIYNGLYKCVTTDLIWRFLFGLKKL